MHIKYFLENLSSILRCAVSGTEFTLDFEASSMTKRNIKCLINNFHIDYMLKW